MKSSGQSTKFPAPVYPRYRAGSCFADAKRYFLEPLLEIEYAHTLMLAKQGIMPESEAAACLRALDALDQDEIRGAAYDGTFEDLFFYLEKKLAALCGEEVAGKMHTARSRNDIDLTMYRMVLRSRLLGLFSAQMGLRQVLIDLAWRHRAALIPAYTHNQPAQPTTLGHYLIACIEILERDAERIRDAYVRVNRNPLGACAITTTGFPIDRSFTTKLLRHRCSAGELVRRDCSSGLSGRELRCALNCNAEPGQVRARPAAVEYGRSSGICASAMPTCRSRASCRRNGNPVRTGARSRACQPRAGGGARRNRPAQHSLRRHE